MWINTHTLPGLLQPPQAVLAGAFIYILFAWLLGGYTLLNWPSLKLRMVLQRMACIALVSMAAIVLIGWAFDGGTQVGLLDRLGLIQLLIFQSSFALFIRLALGALNRQRQSASWHLMAAPSSQKDVVREWQRNPFVRPPGIFNPDSLGQPQLLGGRRIGLAVASNLALNAVQLDHLDQLRARGMTVTTIEELAQRQLERLPPTLLPEHWLAFSDLAWSNEFSFERKLKRMADVFLSTVLLVPSLPLLLIFSVLILLEDRGPVFYVQERTGWLNRPFRLFKLRTMRQRASNCPTPWTLKGDPRITLVGQLLRRTRLDELPQLINVLKGDMSLIGPRPEQPSLDEQLSEQIPHYRKRYWMLPGLSGWAQVCGPAYPSSLDEAEIKLSYDLYYLRNWTIGLDLLILAKTVKTVLKFRGR